MLAFHGVSRSSAFLTIDASQVNPFKLQGVGMVPHLAVKSDNVGGVRPERVKMA